jgi:signal transduction histidine kinase/ActR/RegA family two-component response regulator
MNLLKEQFQRYRHLSVQHRVLVSLFIALFAFDLIFGLLADSYLVQSTIENYAEELLLDANFYDKTLQNELNANLNTIKSRAKVIADLKIYENPYKLTTIFNAIKDIDKYFVWIGYAQLNGKVLASTGGMLVGQSVYDRPWFQEGLNTSALLDLHPVKLLENMLPRISGDGPIRVIDITSPVKNDKDEVLGVVGAHLNQEWVDKKLSIYSDINSHRVERNKNYSTLIVGKDNITRIRISDKSISFNKTTLEELRKQPSKWLIAQSNEGHQVILAIAENDKVTEENKLDWATVIAEDFQDVTNHVWKIRLILFGSLLVASALIWELIRTVFKSIDKNVNVFISNLELSKSTNLPLISNNLPKEYRVIEKNFNEVLTSIREREQQLKSAIESLNESYGLLSINFPGVLIKIRESRSQSYLITYLSETAEKYLNLDPNFVPIDIHKLFINLGDEEKNELEKRLIDQVKSKSDIDLTFKCVGKDGKTRALELRATKRKQSKISEWEGVLVDITELMEAKTLAANADEAKSKFLATMSHELRTPLNGIKGFAELLHTSLKDEQELSDAKNIIEMTDMLTQILNDILDYSKIEEGMLSLEKKPFNLLMLAKSCAHVFEFEAKKRGLDLVQNFEINRDLHIIGDSTRLRQIINNLLNNALKFTEHGFVEISIHSLSTDVLRSLIKIDVKDTGIGMGREQQKNLFKRFQQASDNTFRKYGGSGLGLSIVKGYVDAMGGRIKVASEIGLGTTISLEIEFDLADKVEELEVSQTINKEVLEILIADDVEMNRHIINRILSKDQHKISEAIDGLDVIKKIQNKKYDIIILDIEMPNMTGYQVAENIRGSSNPNKDTYIIALSGNAFDQDIQQSLKSGMNAHLTKPVSFEKLKQQIALFRENIK